VYFWYRQTLKTSSNVNKKVSTTDISSRWPFKPWHHYTNSPYCSPCILLSTSWEILFKHQDNSSSVIISLILATFKCYNALIWWGEIWCWSLLGLKGLKVLPIKCTCPSSCSSGFTNFLNIRLFKYVDWYNYRLSLLIKVPLAIIPLQQNYNFIST